MPPRKKIVKKTVRKPKSKTPTQTQAEEPTVTTETLTAEPMDTETLTEEPTATETLQEELLATENVKEEPTAVDTLTDDPTAGEALKEEATAVETLTEKPTGAETLMESTDTVTLTEELSPRGTLGGNLTSSETLVEELTATPTLTVEPIATEIPIEEAAATETPIQEPKAAEILTGEMASETLTEKPTTTEIQIPEPRAAETSQEPFDTAKKTKTVTRVRKVLKKKIIKKLVPKAPKVAQEVEKIEEEMVAKNFKEEKEKSPSPDDAPIVDNAMKEEEEVGGDEEGRILEGKNRKKTEIFIGGLARNAKEEDLRKVFGNVGEIVELRMIMDGQSGKNKGYAFIRYADARQAKKAVAQFEKVEVCGKVCGASALKGNDTIFLGNIDKRWKKEDIIKLLKDAGIEKIEDVNVMPDPNNTDFNRGFAFLELQTNKDAHNAYKKLQKKDAFGEGLNVKVSWAEPLNDPDEEEMKKVKSVYVEGIPASWNEENVKESFKKFGEIERIVLACNMNSAKRKDFAFVNYKTREGAVSCIEAFDKEDLAGNGSKVNVKVSLAKPVQKGKQNKGVAMFSNKNSTKEKPKPVQRDTKASISSSMGKSSFGGYASSHGTNSSRPHEFTQVSREQGTWKQGTNSSRPHEFTQVSREQGTWKQGHVGYVRDPTVYDYTYGIGGKRSFSSLGDEHLYSDIRGHPRARRDDYPATGLRYGALSEAVARTSHPYFQHPDTGHASGASHQPARYPATLQMSRGVPPYGSSYYSRY